MRMRECTVPLSPEPLLFTQVNIGSSRNSSESHFTLSVWCFSCTEVHIYMHFTLSLQRHMNIQSHYVVVLKRTVSLRQIISATQTPLKWYTVARRFCNNIFMIYIYSDPEYWVRAMNNYMCSLIICSWSDIFDNIAMTGKKGYCTEQSFTILICSAKILTRRRMSKLVI